MLKYILKYFHDSKFSCHNSIIKTFRDISKYFYTKNLYAIVKDYVKSCKICQEIRPYTRIDKIQLSSNLPKTTFDEIYVDFIGPIIKSPEGFRYIFSVVDNYSKFAFAIPTKQQTSSIAIYQLQQIFMTNGYPKVIIADNGPAFSSTKYRLFCVNNGIQARFCSPYTPTSNKAETLNKQIKYNLACIIKEYSATHKNWSKFLGFTIFNYNNSYKTVIGTSPAEIYFGRKLNTPFTTINELTHILVDESKPTAEQIDNAIQIAHQKRVIKTLNRPAASKYFVNQYVMMKVMAPTNNNKCSPKFNKKFKGPFIIQKFTSPTSVRIRSPNGKQVFSTSIYNIRPYYKRETA